MWVLEEEPEEVIEEVLEEQPVYEQSTVSQEDLEQFLAWLEEQGGLDNLPEIYEEDEEINAIGQLQQQASDLKAKLESQIGNHEAIITSRLEEIEAELTDLNLQKEQLSQPEAEVPDAVITEETEQEEVVPAEESLTEESGEAAEELPAEETAEDLSEEVPEEDCIVSEPVIDEETVTEAVEEVPVQDNSEELDSIESQISTLEEERTRLQYSLQTLSSSSLDQYMGSTPNAHEIKAELEEADRVSCYVENGVIVGSEEAIATLKPLMDKVDSLSSLLESMKMQAVYRLYNASSGEHFYTTSQNEYNSLQNAGWKGEGVGWYAPASDSFDSVYRLYNPNTGLHHYTMDASEASALAGMGWKNEGVSFYSDNVWNGTSIYRLYNPNSGLHHFTDDASEASALANAGWKNEGISWYGRFPYSVCSVSNEYGSGVVYYDWNDNPLTSFQKISGV